jgi:hypothetical protein
VASEWQVSGREWQVSGKRVNECSGNEGRRARVGMDLYGVLRLVARIWGWYLQYFRIPYTITLKGRVCQNRAP